MRITPYAALKCNTVINKTFFQTILLSGLGPSFSLYVVSNASSLVASGGAMPVPDLRCCCCFISNASASVIVAAVW